MSTLLALLRKDFHCLWPQVLPLWAFMPLAIFLSQGSFEHSDGTTFWLNGTVVLQLLVIAAPFACCNLAIAAVQQEAMVGDRHYWLTRPFSRVQLAVSKALFLLLAINAPLFLCQAATLASHGLSVGSHVPDLLWRQVFCSTYFVLLPAAAAAVTRTLTQAAAVLLGAALPTFAVQAYLDSSVIFWPPRSNWVPDCATAVVAILGTCSVLLIQYAWRRAAIAAVLFAVMVPAAVSIPFLIPWHSAFALQVKLSTEPVAATAYRIQFDPSGRNWRGEAPIRWQGGVNLEIPISLRDAPDDAQTFPAGSTLWHGASGFALLHDVDRGQGWLHVSIAHPSLNKDGSVDLGGTLYLALLRERGRFRLPPPEARIQVPGIGVCDGRREVARCFSPQPHAALAVTLRYGYAGNETYDIPPQDACAPFPTSPWLNPLHAYPWRAKDPVLQERFDKGIAIVRQPVAWFTRTFHFRGIRLADYQVR